MEKINQTPQTKTKESIHCYHCGEICAGKNIQVGDKIFCCNGCKLVYELLKEKDLCAYYSLTQTPGSTPPESGIKSKYRYLDDETVKRQLISFSDGTVSKITFKIPAIHCSSCIWLLENLYRVDPGIIESKVNYLRKELSLSFREEQTNLRKIVEVLTSIGYEPEISLATLKKEVQKSTDKELYLQIGVAGFAFGNIMLLSFPEYLAIGETIDREFLSFFGYLSIFLALPVFFYSSMGYFRSAYHSLKQKAVNMDVPISLGILTLFTRSLVETFSVGGVAYLDSFAGLVFLLLIGKLFQKKTYDTLSFDRDYRSYFPLSVTRKTKTGEESIPLQKLKIGDRIVLTNKELIPADAVLIKGPALIDYSFVTGESKAVNKISGDMIYAGGMHLGSQIELEIVKEVSQSYLTQLWNDDAFSKQKGESKMTTLANVVSKYFTFIVLTIAALAAMYRGIDCCLPLRFGIIYAFYPGQYIKNFRKEPILFKKYLGDRNTGKN
jgi:Cu+-exporting ATPase